ncbi:MAG: FAD-dependent oxidoreductase [Lentisphaeria bacterium]|nr:MAG: FAD-dependent oxidoreductase [Lentisphaeria bacterium]
MYLPLCDGFGHQVISGLSEEFMRASTEFSPFELHKKWGGETSHMRRHGNRFEVYFSPAGFTLTLDEFLKKANVDLWLESLVCTVQKDGNRITVMEVENISRRGIIEVDCFVDASGSAVFGARRWRQSFP